MLNCEAYDILNKIHVLVEAARYLTSSPEETQVQMEILGIIEEICTRAKSEGEADHA